MPFDSNLVISLCCNTVNIINIARCERIINLDTLNKHGQTLWCVSFIWRFCFIGVTELEEEPDFLVYWCHWDTEDPDNYRPISLTPCISKIFETILRDQNVDYLWSEKLITKTQYGFRKKFLTTDAITYCTEFTRSAIDKIKYVSAALLDLSKTFDSINDKIFEEKIDIIGFNTSSRLFIKNCLSHREQQLRIQKILSDPVKLKRGVPQRKVFGPLLFNLYINDINNLTTKQNLFNMQMTQSFSHLITQSKMAKKFWKWKNNQMD